MRAPLIVFAAVASLDIDQEVRKRENIQERSYSMSQLRVYDEDKSHRQLSCRFDLALTKKNQNRISTRLLFIRDIKISLLEGMHMPASPGAH